jgi:regulator of RNase E activity RraA
MKHIARFTAIVAACLPLTAQILQFSKEEMMKWTPKNPFERFEDGRPKVPDALLKRAKLLSAEDCWGVLRRANYRNTFEGNWNILHSDKKVFGRALTAVFMPERPDLNELVMAGLKGKGFPSGGHQYVIDLLQPGDVLVASLFADTGGFVGDNLAAYIGVATKEGGGLVVDGGVRDLQGLKDLDMQIYYRYAHPDAIKNTTLVGLNVPVRIGGVTVMPGDMIVGDREGITVVPPELVEKTVDGAVEIFVHDEWTKIKLRTGKYKSHEIYGSPRDPELKKEYEEYKNRRMEELKGKR